MKMADFKNSKRQLLTFGKHSTHVTRRRPIKAIQHLKERTYFKDQNILQHSFFSHSLCNTCSSKPSSSKRKRKRSQGTEDQVSQTKDQPIDSRRKTYTKENGEYYQLPSPLTSNSHEQSIRKKRRRAVSIQLHSIEPDKDTIPEENPEALKSEEKEKNGLINYWVANHTWPNSLTGFCAMSSSNNIKRPRTSDRSQSNKDEESRSYSQCRKDRDVPEQYSKAYEQYILTKGLNMNYIKGREFVSSNSKAVCQDLRKMECVAISPTIYPIDKIIQVVDLCQNANEAMVSRDITTLILPPIKALHLTNEATRFKDLTDQVKAQWHESWILAGPRPEPDLAIGFLHSAFTISENEKLTNYTSFENLTRSTNDMCFPFLMCEVKCGNKGLDYADRQNMHSCSVAVKALLKLEQKADQYRKDKQFENLLGRILVYSISHDQKDARLYGHYALVEEEKWTYYRHHIRHYDIAHEENDLLALHNFARNVLTAYAPTLLKRLQKAIAALPVSFTQSFSTNTMTLEDDSQHGSQQPFRGRDSEGPATPDLHASTQKLLDVQKEQMNKLIDQMQQQMERQRQQMERQMEDLEREKRELLDLQAQKLTN